LTDAVNERIMKLRGLFISKGLDLDYTTALNFLVHYGDEKIQRDGWDPLAFAILKTHFESGELKEGAIIDEWADVQEYKKWKKQQA
jgi:hypothetical protein